MEVRNVAKRLLTEHLININDIAEEIKYIQGSDDYYISENGNVYVNYGNNNFYQKKN